MANGKGGTVSATTMSDRFQSILQKVKSFWSSSQRNVVIITMFSMISAIIVVIMLWASSERFRPLYSTSSNYDSSQVLSLLDQSGLKYELSQDNGQIMVPEEEVARTRMILAAKGLKQQLPSGFDALDNKSTLGESQFMENARYRYALEGELARSIVTMDAISVARVHLAIPKASLFSRKEDEQARASVIVQLIEGMDLKPSQVDSIVNLVSGAIIGLKSDNVRVVDQYGRLLSDDAATGDLSVSTNKQIDFRRNLEKNLVRQASDMLTPIVGAANFRVQVSAQMDFSKRQETEETYGQPVVRSETVLSDRKNGAQALGVPGALSNTPPVTDTDPAEEPTRQDERSEAKRDYAISGKVSHIQHQQGIVEKLSISVIVNDNSGVGDGWEEAQLQQIENVVRNAIGFDMARGDTINITSFPFIASNDMDSILLPWYENPNIMQPIKYLLGILLSALLIVLVLRPLVQYLTKSDEVNDGALLEHESAKLELAEQLEGLEAANDMDDVSPLGLDAAGIKALDDELPPSDSPLEVQIQHLKMIAEKDPQRVAEILRTWIHV